MKYYTLNGEEGKVSSKFGKKVNNSANLNVRTVKKKGERKRGGVRVRENEREGEREGKKRGGGGFKQHTSSSWTATDEQTLVSFQRIFRMNAIRSSSSS